jgi:nucleoid-associated protein YejK
MSILEQTEIQSKIAQIIERSRHHEEQFLVDSRTAASDIIQFLKKKNLIEGFYDEKNLSREN